MNFFVGYPFVYRDVCIGLHPRKKFKLDPDVHALTKLIAFFQNCLFYPAVNHAFSYLFFV
ncbi:MAG: hypothetical protein HQ542_12980 [Bacteroidia bacterium]|nr:hypothetical protein [Bacteroidia bacterium]